MSSIVEEEVRKILDERVKELKRGIRLRVPHVWSIAAAAMLIFCAGAILPTQDEKEQVVLFMLILAIGLAQIVVSIVQLTDLSKKKE